MDFMLDNEEDSKYAFLLGSALRNDDPEQLFVVYDNLIPTIISERRLERIKEGARYISELPEYDFNALVLNARTFSLASGRTSATSNMSMENHTSRPGGFCLDEDEEGEAVSIMQGEKATTTHYGSLDLQATLKPTSSKAVDDGLKVPLLDFDQDSGFPGSSSFKASSLKNSISCSESNDDSEEDRPGCFDYTQLTQKSRTQEHVRIRHTLNPEFDEDIKVDSSTGGSSVESPRSETSGTHEEYSLAGDVEMQEFSRSTQDTRRGDGSYPASITAVNEHQHLYGKRNNTDFYEFDSWSNVEPKRAETIRSSYNCCQDPILGGSAGAASQKKSHMGARGYSKDDSDKVTSPIGLDVNGNPSSLDAEKYHQMRQPVSAAKVVEGGSSSLSTLSNHHTLTTTQTPLGSAELTSELGKKKYRKQKRQAKQTSQLSESVSDFKGNQPIEDILSFIEGGENDNDPKKIVTQTCAGKTDKQKKKQEKIKEDPNGQEEKTTANSIKPTKSSPSVIQSSAVMGNNTAKDCLEDSSQNVDTNTISALPSSVKKNNVNTTDDHDHNSSEFFDCLNSLPGDDKAQQMKSSLPENVIVESNTDRTNQEAIVNSRNFKNDAKNCLGVKVKGSGRKYTNDKIEDMMADGNALGQYSSLTKQRANSFESYDSAPHTNKVSDVKIEDIAAQESFTEVKKKKKRNVSNFTNLSGNAQQNHSYYSKDINGQSTYNKPWRPPRPSQTGAANSTTHSSGNSTLNSKVSGSNKPSSLMIRNSNEEGSLDKYPRDLSPNSFPALNGPRPERRNSCGDINDVKAEVVSETRSYCDSDKESVKSLPAAHNVRAAGESSPSYRSYANMLVTAQQERRRHGDSSNSPSSESGIVCGSQTSSINSYHPHSSFEMVSPPPANASCDANCSAGASTPDRKTTVWKGSPRERRHSIGSSPDDSKPETDKSSVNSRHRQKSGSQECLAINLASTSVSGAKEANTKELGSSTSSSSEVPIVHHPRDNVVRSLDMETEDSNSKESHKKSTSITPKVVSTLSSVNRLSASGLSDQLSPVSSAAIHYHNPSSPDTARGNKTKATPVSKMTLTAKQSGSSDTANKKGSSNNKSVIFLDERFGNNKATDLGITFGFDSSYEPTLNKTTDPHNSQRLTKSSITSSNVITTVPSISSQQKQTSTPKSSMSSSTSSSNIPATSTRIPGSSSSELTPQHQSSDIKQPPSSLSRSSEKQLLNGPHKSSPSNGLVFPTGSVMKGISTTTAATVTKPVLSTNISSATTPTTTSNSQNSSTVDNKGSVISQTGNEASVSQNEVTVSFCGGNDNMDSNRPSTTTNSNSCNLLPQQQSTMSHNANEKHEGKKVTHTLPPHPPNNQPQPTHVVPLPPNATNSPLVMPHAFIGTTVLFSPHYPPPPIHQVVAMPPPPPLPSATVVDKPSPAITTIHPSTNPIPTNTNQASAEIPSVSASSMPTSVTPPVLSSSSNESATVTSPIPSMPSITKTESAPIQPVDGPVKVVYGLRIRPDGGCGTVFFRPLQHGNKKHRKNNFMELSGLLKRKWTEVKDLQKKGTENYITVSDQ